MLQLTHLKSSFIFRQACIHQLLVEHLLFAKLLSSGGQQWNKNSRFCGVYTLACMAVTTGGYILQCEVALLVRPALLLLLLLLLLIAFVRF